MMPKRKEESMDAHDQMVRRIGMLIAIPIWLLSVNVVLFGGRLFLVLWDLFLEWLTSL